MMNTASSSSVAVSLASRGAKRMTPSRDRQAPVRITSPSTSSAFANSEPRIENCATTTSPAESAKSTMKSSGRLPSDACSTPVTAGPKCCATPSVANETTHASPASATAETTKITTGSAPPSSSAAVASATTATRPSRTP